MAVNHRPESALARLDLFESAAVYASLTQDDGVFEVPVVAVAVHHFRWNERGVLLVFVFSGILREM